MCTTVIIWWRSEACSHSQYWSMYTMLLEKLPASCALASVSRSLILLGRFSWSTRCGETLPLLLPLPSESGSAALYYPSVFIYQHRSLEVDSLLNRLIYQEEDLCICRVELPAALCDMANSNAVTAVVKENTRK
eukprot:3215310-Amphidinium_carterae.2